MRRTVLRSKIHRATVTGANLDYEGSITIDGSLIEAADLAEYEKVQVVNVTNGARLETYVIAGDAGGGAIFLNGGAARCGAVGDKVIILSYGLIDESDIGTSGPRVVHVDKDNKALT